MASIRKEIVIEVSPENVWTAVRDVGAIHVRLVRGFVVDCRLEGDARIVTFANGLVVRELIVDVDDDRAPAGMGGGGWTAHAPQCVGAGVRRGGWSYPARLDRRLAAERDGRDHRRNDPAGDRRHEADA